jgi:16S rRNA (cytosine1402-N4)-methyltransferase
MTLPWAHEPVLLAEVVAHLHLRPGARCLDATVNGGGHAAAMLAATAPSGRVLGIDRDAEVLDALRARMAGDLTAGRLRLVHGSFADLERILAEHDFVPIDAALFDLGLSSFHLDASGRGFTFSRDEPLDMRFDAAATGETAAQLLATRDAAELTALFRDLGEERFASRIARSIVAQRRSTPIASSGQLLDLVTRSLPAQLRWRAARHAARIFQALRIAVNDELAAIRAALPQAIAALAPAGRLAVISFHSLEDRLVKQFFRSEAAAGRVLIITRKPVRPGEDEIAANPRAASAKLRVVERREE